jgi:hypothetical protein
MRKKLSVLFLTVAILVLIPTISVSAKKPFIGDMNLDWVGVGHSQGFLTWEGIIEFRDFEGGPFYMRFFFVDTGIPRQDPTGSAGHFGEIWEIWSAHPSVGYIILAGTDKGITNIEKDMTWKYRMNGIVDCTAPEWEVYSGRNVHMSGTITWVKIEEEATAPGIFRIN